jgi:hypothetical protein
MNWCAMYHKKGRLIRAGIEVHGKGEEFADAMMRAAKGWKVKQLTTGNKSKGERFENQMAPVMMGDRFRITTAPGAFIDQFVDEYLSYDGMGTYTDDTLDAVYYCIRLAKGFINWSDDDVLYGSPIKQIIQKNPLYKFARRRHGSTQARVV